MRSGALPVCCSSKRGAEVVRLQVCVGLVEHPSSRRLVPVDGEHRERQPERRAELAPRVAWPRPRAGCRRRRAAAARIREIPSADEHRLRALAGHALRRAAEQAGRELLVHAAVADDHQVGGPRVLRDLVRHDAHRRARYRRARQRSPPCRRTPATGRRRARAAPHASSTRSRGTARSRASPRCRGRTTLRSRRCPRCAGRRRGRRSACRARARSAPQCASAPNRRGQRGSS